MGLVGLFVEVVNALNFCFNQGLCGGSASGKTTVAKKIIEELNVQWVSLLCMDSFYKVTFCSNFIALVV